MLDDEEGKSADGACRLLFTEFLDNADNEREEPLLLKEKRASQVGSNQAVDAKSVEPDDNERILSEKEKIKLV